MGQWGEALFCGGTILGKSTPMLNLNRSEIKNSFSEERYTRGRINLASTPTVYCPRCILSPSTSVLSFQYVARFRNTLSDVVARAGGASGKVLEGIWEGHLQFLAKQTAASGTLTHSRDFPFSYELHAHVYTSGKFRSSPQNKNLIKMCMPLFPCERMFLSLFPLKWLHGFHYYIMKVNLVLDYTCLPHCYYLTRMPATHTVNKNTLLKSVCAKGR